MEKITENNNELAENSNFSLTKKEITIAILCIILTDLIIYGFSCISIIFLI